MTKIVLDLSEDQASYFATFMVQNLYWQNIASHQTQEPTIMHKLDLSDADTGRVRRAVQKMKRGRKTT